MNGDLRETARTTCICLYEADLNNLFDIRKAYLDSGKGYSESSNSQIVREALRLLLREIKKDKKYVDNIEKSL